MKRAVRAAALLVAFVLASIPLRGGAADPYEIHAIVALTGALSFAGNAQLGGLQALEDYVNRTGGIRGRPIKIVPQDNASSPQTAVQLMNALAAQHVPVILGAADVASCNAMFPLAKDGPVVYCMSNAAAPAPGTYGFASGVANADLNVVGIRYLRQRGLTRIAELSTGDAIGQLYDRAIDAALALPENRGMTLVDREHFAPSDVSVVAQLARIKAANPQAVILGTSGNAVGTAFHGIVDLGLTLPVFTGNSAATWAMMRQYAQILPKDLYFFSFLCLGADEVSDPSTKAALRAFFGALEARGIKADGLESISWDPALIVVEALRKLGTNATAAQIKDYVANLHGWSGADGPYDFRAHPQRGLGPEDAIVVRWDASRDTWTAVSKPGGVPVRTSK